MSTTSIKTLGDLQREGYRVQAHCGWYYCQASAELDLDMLINRFGADFVFVCETAITARLICQKCKRRCGSLRYRPPYKSDL